jgi:transcriptional regulator with XRE-family HTH domain
MPGPRRSSQREYATALGSRLRQLRRERRLTQRQVAERVPMSAGNLSRIEGGDQGPPADEVIRSLADALGADATELLALAGRAVGATDVDTDVLRELRALRQEMREGFERLERAVAAQRSA